MIIIVYLFSIFQKMYKTFFCIILIIGLYESAFAATWTKDSHCITWTYSDCEARPNHPVEYCRAGQMVTDCESHPFWNFPDCLNVGCAFASTCEPNVKVGDVTEVPNGIDDNCDGFVDDEQCDGIDNDGNGIVDDSPGSCLTKILFVPLAWEGGIQSEFESAARTQWNAIKDSLNLSACEDHFAHRYLNVQNDNIAEPTCNTGCGLSQVSNAFMARADAEVLRREYDVIAFLTNKDICNNIAGCSDGNQFVWVETADNSVLAHEIGHIRILEDEYCSNQAGSTDERCNDGGIPLDYDGNGIIPPPDLNILSATLGCDPRNDEGCCGASACADVNYGICCEGNRNSGSGRCIMSYANAENPRLFCDNCQQHLLNDWITRAVWNNVTHSNDLIPLPPLSCAYQHQGSGPVIYIDYIVNETGQISVSRSFSGRGRLGLKSPQNQGRYGIEISNNQGDLLYQSAENISFKYDGPRRFGANYSGIAYATVARGISAPVQKVETGPVKITALKDGVVTSQTCLASAGALPNGGVSLTVDSTPPTIQCPSNTTLECTEYYGVSANNALLAPFFNGYHATDSCDPNPKVTNNAPAFFNLGTTPVIFTATDVDKNVGSCSATVGVRDTTPPTVSCPQNITIECAAIGGTPSNDPQLANFFNGFTAVDKCDASITISNNAPAFFKLGATAVTFTATDDSGNTSACQAVVQVVDTTRPNISVNLTPNVLWPPNHKMVNITSNIRVADICDATPSVVLLSITMNEGDETKGDGHTSNDIQVDEGGRIYLRAERSGAGNGRVYSIKYTATDISGNNTSTLSVVTVPHNQ